MNPNSNPNRRYNGRGRGNYNNRNHNNMNNHNNGFMNGVGGGGGGVPGMVGIPNNNQNGYNRQSINPNYHPGQKQPLMDENATSQIPLDHSGPKMPTNLLPSPINSMNQAAVAAQANCQVPYGRYDSNMNVMSNGNGNSMPLSIPNGMPPGAPGNGVVDQQLQNGYQYYGGGVPYTPMSPYTQMPIATQSGYYYAYSNTPYAQYYGQVPANYGYGIGAGPGTETAPMQPMISPVAPNIGSYSAATTTCNKCRQLSVNQVEVSTMTD